MTVAEVTGLDRDRIYNEQGQTVPRASPSTPARPQDSARSRASNSGGPSLPRKSRHIRTPVGVSVLAVADLR